MGLFRRGGKKREPHESSGVVLTKTFTDMLKYGSPEVVARTLAVLKKMPDDQRQACFDAGLDPKLIEKAKKRLGRQG